MSIDRYGYAPTDSTTADNKPMLVVANRKLDRNGNEWYDKDVALMKERQRVNEERKERRECTTQQSKPVPLRSLS